MRSESVRRSGVKPPPEYPGKEGLMITGVYPPGASDPIHRHNPHALVYALEGFVMQVKGGKKSRSRQAFRSASLRFVQTCSMFDHRRAPACSDHRKPAAE